MLKSTYRETPTYRHTHIQRDTHYTLNYTQANTWVTACKQHNNRNEEVSVFLCEKEIRV